MNSFEEYIKANKEKLDHEQMNPKVWWSLEKAMLTRKNNRYKIYTRILGAAASILLIGSIAMYLFYSPKVNAVDLLAEHGIESKSYITTVNNKKAALNQMTIPIDQKENFDLLLKQIEFLDAQYDDYLQYVNQNGYQEFIGQQILNYYKTKIELLSKIQQEIEKINYYENKYHKKSPSTPLNI